MSGGEMVVTAKQLAEGYKVYKGVGEPPERRPFVVIRQLPNGTYLVVTPGYQDVTGEAP